MAPGPGNHNRLDLACEPSATRDALRHAKDVLRRWQAHPEVLGDALVIVDELVTNAVRYTGGNAEPFDPERARRKVSVCGLELSVVDGSLLIAVHDESTSLPVLREISLEAEGGRGLQLVAGLSEGNWGHTLLESRAGKTVWARLPFKGFARCDAPSDPAIQRYPHMESGEAELSRHAAVGRPAVIA